MQVDDILEQWHSERPDLDVAPMGVIGRLSRAHVVVNAALTRNYGRFGFDPGSFDVLFTLTRSGPPYTLSPSALASSSMITSAAVAQRLNKLEATGLVERHANERDGRGTLVALTEAGRRLVERVLPAHLATEEKLLEPLSTTERAQLAELLEKLLRGAGPQLADGTRSTRSPRPS